MATRTTRRGLRTPRAGIGGGDLNGIMADYSEDAILIVQGKVYRGMEGVRQVFTQLLGDGPDAQWEVDTVFADDLLYLEWKATASSSKVEDGIDTFVFRDGLIRAQTVVYTVQPV